MTIAAAATAASAPGAAARRASGRTSRAGRTKSDVVAPEAGMAALCRTAPPSVALSASSQRAPDRMLVATRLMVAIDSPFVGAVGHGRLHESSRGDIPTSGFGNPREA